MDCNKIPASRLVGITSNMIRRAMDKKFSNLPYSPTETACISFITECVMEITDAQIFQRDIEREFNLRSSSASELIKNLEQKGLLRRESIDNDKRCKKLIPTEKAIEFNKKNRVKLHELEQCIVKDISPEDLQVYRKVIKQMIHNLHMEEING